MKRRFRQIACVLSAMLFVVLPFLWGRSTSAEDHLFYCTCQYDDAELETITLYSVQSNSGSIGLTSFRQTAPIPDWRKTRRLGNYWSWQTASPDNGTLPRNGPMGFRIGRVTDLVIGPPAPYRCYAAIVPYWLLILLAATLPVRALWLLRREVVRARKGFCLKCGYDLRGSDDRCSECGTLKPGHGVAV